MHDFCRAFLPCVVSLCHVMIKYNFYVFIPVSSPVFEETWHSVMNEMLSFNLVLISVRFPNGSRHIVEMRTGGGGGGGYSMYPWLGRSGAAPHALTLFKKNIADFPTHFKTEFQFLIPCLRHLTQ